MQYNLTLTHMQYIEKEGKIEINFLILNQNICCGLVGTQENSLTEIVLLSTQKIYLKTDQWIRKYLHFYILKFVFRPIEYSIF